MSQIELPVDSNEIEREGLAWLHLAMSSMAAVSMRPPKLGPSGDKLAVSLASSGGVCGMFGELKTVRHRKVLAWCGGAGGVNGELLVAC